jgi:type IV pilus assembly protein PilE
VTRSHCNQSEPLAVTPHCPHPTIAAAQRRRGFTLIEVMIVVAIIAILASVALPSYLDYVRRGQLPEAQGAMSDFRVKMEQYYQDNRNYGTAQCADNGPPTWSAGNGTLNYSAAQFFTYTCALTAGGQGYTVTATGSASRAIGHVYTVDQNNTRATTKYKGAVVAKACWLIKGTEC